MKNSRCGFGDQTLTSVKLKKSPTPPRIFRASVAWYSIIPPQVEQELLFLQDWWQTHKEETHKEEMTFSLQQDESTGFELINLHSVGHTAKL